MGKYWDLITHPSELRAVIQWAVFHDPLHERDRAKETPTLKTCYDLLELTSRSFSMVIQELQPELRVPVLYPMAVLIRLYCSILF
jgi:farnesyl-diphosphate farnesyltransferase